jgi:hypothetical protein
LSRTHLANVTSAVIRSGSNVSLAGGPALGKSRFAQRVSATLDKADEPGPRLTKLSMDLTTVDCGLEAMQDLHAQVRLRAGRLPLREVAPDLRSCARGLADDLEALPYAYVVVDDLDACLRFRDGAEYLRHLRQLLSGDSAPKINGLVISRRPIRQIEESVRGVSTLAGVCYPHFLKPMTADEVALEWDLTAEVAGTVEAWCGGLPALVDYWTTSNIADVPQEESVREDAFAAQLRYLDDLKLVPAVAQHVLGPLVDDFARETGSPLGILSATNSGLSPLSGNELFQDLLRARTRDSEAWGRFGAAEVALRSMVDATLTDAFGLDWADVVSARSRSNKRLIDAARQNRDRDRQRYSSSVSWLSYTYPAELWQLVQDNWEHFSTTLRFDRSHWRVRIEGLASLRAPMAHNRGELLSPAQRAQILAWAEDILRACTPREPLGVAE